MLFRSMAASEAVSGGRQKVAILAGVCEAVIAALYLDGGLEAARAFVDRYWSYDDPGSERHDPKSQLQEWTQSGALPERVQPVYSVSARSGPDHAPMFTVTVTVPGYVAEGAGASKRDAEQDAARRMLAQLGLKSE